MNDEIKEKKTKRIIEKIEGLATYVTIPRELAIYNVNIDSQEAKLLIDYITNLQESEAYYYGYYKDYKLRKDKATEYIKEQLKFGEFDVMDAKVVLQMLEDKE